MTRLGNCGCHNQKMAATINCSFAHIICFYSDLWERGMSGWYGAIPATPCHTACSFPDADPLGTIVVMVASQ
jgi:hypothetical protein